MSGYRRHRASELAGFADMPVIVRNLTDEQAITQMVEDNTNQRENILPRPWHYDKNGNPLPPQPKKNEPER